MAVEERALLRRCLDIELERDTRVSERVSSHEWGRSFLNPSLDRVWDANCIVMERTGMAVEEIVAAADEEIGSLGMRHRTVVIFDEAEGKRLQPEFELLGWDSEPGVYMTLQRPPDREPAIEVAECRQSEIEDLRRRLIRAELATIGQLDDLRASPSGRDLSGLSGAPGEAGELNDVVVDQLLEWERRIGEVDGDRWFVAPADGDPASACRLLARDGVGQVEDVGTLAERREQGLARAVVLAAARASVKDGNELTYIGALANDWPRLLYAKLGFEEVGVVYDFKRKPLRVRS